MPEYPLLIFPDPTRADRVKLRGFADRPRIPTHGRQTERLAPQFRALQQAMERRTLLLQDSALGVQPEQVLILETIGTIANFVNAIRRIEGLEWLGELELSDISPEFGFQDESRPEKSLKGQIFLVMTNQQALKQMQSLFIRWQKDRETKFPYGLAKLRNAFRYLYNIRPWSATDRIRETGLLENWRFRIDNDESTLPFEAELWFRNDVELRGQTESLIRSIVESLGGEILQRCVIPDIGYHAILGALPPDRVQEILEDSNTWENVELLRCDGIMHFRPIGQCVALLPDDAAQIDTSQEGMLLDNELGDPIVALLDGMPLSGHQLLRDRLAIDDPDDYESAYQAHERMHGTAMGSLIIHGDLDEGGSPVGRRIYARPIMKPWRDFNDQFGESIPQDVLPVDLIHRAVRRLFESDGDQMPVAPQVRVINLSVCDSSRPFDRVVSPWARLLDWLAWKYNVLFIVSAGNHTHEIQLPIDRADFSKVQPSERQRLVIQALANDTRNRRLMSPSETLNGLTIGATHQDSSVDALKGNFGLGVVDPYEVRGLPNVVNAQGPGYGRIIKPDLLLPGGRQFLTEKLVTTHTNATFEVRGSTREPGQRVATPGNQGRLDRTFYSRGTSNAAALASRSAMLIYDVLEQLRLFYPGKLSDEYDTVLLKALLVHGSDMGDVWDIYEQALKNGQNSRNFKEFMARFLGNGLANISKVLACTEQRVTVLGVGRLQDGEGDSFTFPLPPTLSSKNCPASSYRNFGMVDACIEYSSEIPCCSTVV